jgi:hypothetical protein
MANVSDEHIYIVQSAEDDGIGLHEKVLRGEDDVIVESVTASVKKV